MLVCASCGGVFHYPDSRVGEEGPTCGAHLIGLRTLTGRDATPLCLRCDMAFRLEHGIPAS